MRQTSGGLRFTAFKEGLSRQAADALRRCDAEVITVPLGLDERPDDTSLLRFAIESITSGRMDVVAFADASQGLQVLRTAGEMDMATPFRESMKKTLVGAADAATSRALRECGLGVDFEPDRPTFDDLLCGLARVGAELLRRKRASYAAGVDTTCMRRIDAVWPTEGRDSGADPLYDSVFMRACRCEPVSYTPIWLMRQAGRYQREYREIRERVSFLELCKTPELAAEVTLMAVDQLGVDAAIIFADILLIVEPMGVGLTFEKGAGPSIPRPVRTGLDVGRLKEVDPADSLSFVFDAIRMTRRALRPDVPLIGFCGAPFTVASYMIEGGPSRDFKQTRSLMTRDPGAWNALMRHLVRAEAKYLNGQIEAGAQVVQLFDSWVGCLGHAEYREFVLPHSRALIEGVRPGVPVIHFGVNTSGLLEAMCEAGGDVIGVDWHVDLADTWSRLGYDRAIQGNLDPQVLLSSPSEIRRHVHDILERVGGRAGHIFNLGHGILPQTPMDHAIALVDMVHEYGQPSQQ